METSCNYGTYRQHFHIYPSQCCKTRHFHANMPAQKHSRNQDAAKLLQTIVAMILDMCKRLCKEQALKHRERYTYLCISVHICVHMYIYLYINPFCLHKQITMYVHAHTHTLVKGRLATKSCSESESTTTVNTLAVLRCPLAKTWVKLRCA